MEIWALNRLKYTRIQSDLIFNYINNDSLS